MKQLAAVGLVMAAVLGCNEIEQAPPDFARLVSATPIDSVTLHLDVTDPVPPAIDLARLPLDSVLGFRLLGAAYQIRMVDNGFVVLQRRAGRLLRFDSLGRRIAEVPMTGVEDPSSAAICARGDSALIVDGSTLISGPRSLVWLSLRADADTVSAAPLAITLPAGSINLGCLPVGGRWVLTSRLQELPGDFRSRSTTILHEVSPALGLLEPPLLRLPDHSVRLHDSVGKALSRNSPWSPPLFFGGDGGGQLYVIDGASAVVKILDTTAVGPRLRGITRRPGRVTQAMVDSVATDWMARERNRAAASGNLTPSNAAVLDTEERRLRRIEPGAVIPEVDRLLVGAEGSFALLASEWLVPDVNRWDMFAADGGYLGAVEISKASRAVGVQLGALWYVRTAGDSSSGAPELVGVRPASVGTTGH